MTQEKITLAQKNKWVTEARERFRACFSNPEALVNAIIAREFLYFKDQLITNKSFNVNNMNDVLRELSSTYVINGSIITREDMDSEYSLHDLERYDQTLLAHGIVTADENQRLSLSDRLKFNAAAFVAIGSDNMSSGIHAYDACWKAAMDVTDEDDPGVLAISEEKNAFIAELNNMLKKEVKRELLRNPIDVFDRCLVDGVSIDPTLRVYADQLKHEMLNDEALSIEDTSKILKDLSDSIQPANQGNCDSLRRVMRFGAQMIDAKKNERLGRLLLAFAAVIIIIASISLALFTGGIGTPLAVAGIVVGASLLSTGALLENKSTKTLSKLSKDSYAALKREKSSDNSSGIKPSSSI